MRVLVCGGRNFNNVAYVYLTLDRIHAKTPITELIQGGAKGADKIAEAWAATNGIRRWVCKAEWDKYGAAAGPKRNAKMLTWEPDLVIAFPGGAGTENMKRQARAVNIPVMEIGDDETRGD